MVASGVVSTLMIIWVVAEATCEVAVVCYHDAAYMKCTILIHSLTVEPRSLTAK